MDFKQLESFVAVVQEESFTKAAKTLFISQPTISSHIHALEEELSSRLIIRTTKSIEITPRGQELYEYAVNVLEGRNKLMESWSTDAKKVIYLGVSTIPSAYIIPEILPVFGKQYPDVYFHVDQKDSQGIIDAMNNGKYDLGMIGMEQESKNLTCIPFYQDEIVLITPVHEEYLKLQDDFQLTKDFLMDKPLIIREIGSGTLKKADYILDELGLKKDELNIVAQINDQESIKNLTASGLGISFISKKAAQNFVNEKRILAFSLPKTLAARTFYLVVRKNYIARPCIHQFIQFVKQYFAS